MLCQGSKITWSYPQVAALVTPVPGGVGPCTVACLMANTLRYLSYKEHMKYVFHQGSIIHPCMTSDTHRLKGQVVVVEAADEKLKAELEKEV